MKFEGLIVSRNSKKLVLCSFFTNVKKLLEVIEKNGERWKFSNYLGVCSYGHHHAEFKRMTEAEIALEVAQRIDAIQKKQEQQFIRRIR